MSRYVSKPTPVPELLESYRADCGVIKTYKLTFTGVGGRDVYNISHEFTVDGVRYIAGRVEKRDSEISDVVIFERVKEGVYKATDTVFPMMQDPCQCVIDGRILIGGTRIYTGDDGRINNWNTVFFGGKTLDCMEELFGAPAKMKDVRICKTDVYHVFTRPQGGAAGPGKIGYVTTGRLEKINAALMEKAVLLDTQFTDGAWGGVNQLHVLSDGRIGVLGHIAVMSAGDVRHYYGMAFCFDPVSGQCTKAKIICERADFAAGEYKRKDLIDVVFCGGLVRNEDKTANLYVGLSDAEAHCAVIRDPFAEYENE